MYVYHLYHCMALWLTYVELCVCWNQLRVTYIQLHCGVGARSTVYNPNAMSSRVIVVFLLLQSTVYAVVV